MRPIRLTLRARVTFIAGLVIGAAIIGGLLLMYTLQMNSIRRVIHGRLQGYAAQIARSGRDGTWPDPLPAFGYDPNAQAQVLASDGHVLAATRTLAGMPTLYTLPAGSGTPVRQPAADGLIPDDVQVVAVRAVVAGRPVTIVTGTPSGLLSSVEQDFTHRLLIGVPVILALAVGAVWLIVGRALRPVEQIRQAVTDITSADLTQRVPEPESRDEIGKLARTMNDMLARLDEAARRQRRFVADASHELRSPLAAIRTTLEIGLAYPDRAPWPQIAGHATEQAQRLEVLIQQLLMLAKSDDRRLAVRRDPVELAGLLTALLDEVRASMPAAESSAAAMPSVGSSDGTAPAFGSSAAMARDVAVTLALQAESAPVVTGDPALLGRMLRNLVDNAVRHSRGSVVVTLAAGAAAGTVRVDVDDDGPGIPAPERERAFDRFVRLDKSRERGTGNAGLGLAIAREIAVAHHGTITVADSPAGGARLTVILPGTCAAGSEDHPIECFPDTV